MIAPRQTAPAKLESALVETPKPNTDSILRNAIGEHRIRELECWQGEWLRRGGIPPNDTRDALLEGFPFAHRLRGEGARRADEGQHQCLKLVKIMTINIKKAIPTQSLRYVQNDAERAMSANLVMNIDRAD